MIDIVHFITEVKRRPVLWDPNHADYNQRHSKLAAWEDVSANMYVDWGDFSNYDKFGKVRDIQTKWKTIRDNYIRDLKYERKVEKGLAMPKKNKYKYYHLLEFLDVAKKKSKSDQSSTDMEESPEKKEETNQFGKSTLDDETESSSVDLGRKNKQVDLNGSRRAKRLKQNNISIQLNLQSDSSTMDSDSNNQSINKGMKRPKQNNILKEITQQPDGSAEVERNKNQPYNNSESNSQSFLKEEPTQEPNGSVELERNKNQSYNNSEANGQCFSKEMTQESNGSADVERNKKESYYNSESNSQCFQEYFNSENVHNVTAELNSPSVEAYQGVSTLPLDQDDDKMFLLSMVPYFKKLNEERKLEARIEMSTLLQKMIYKK